MDQKSSVSDARVGGVAGLLFASGVLLQNGYLLAGAPMPGASLDAVRAFYVDHGGRIEVAVGWVAVNVLCLLVFGASVTDRLARSPRSSMWARMAWGAIVLLCACFAVTTSLQGGLVVSAETLEARGLLGPFWDLHSIAFAMSGIALSAVLLALSVGALSEGSHRALVPKWVAMLGLAGSASLLVAGGLSVSSASGGPGIFFQLAGFVTWVVWLLAACVRLLRGAGDGALQSAPTS